MRRKGAGSTERRGWCFLDGRGGETGTDRCVCHSRVGHKRLKFRTEDLGSLRVVTVVPKQTCLIQGPKTENRGLTSLVWVPLCPVVHRSYPGLVLSNCHILLPGRTGPGRLLGQQRRWTRVYGGRGPGRGPGGWTSKVSFSSARHLRWTTRTSMSRSCF